MLPSNWRNPPPLTHLTPTPLDHIQIGDHILVGDTTLPLRNMFTLHRRPGTTPGKLLVFPRNITLTVPHGTHLKVRRNAT